MKDTVMGRDGGTGLTLGELRQFVAMTEQYPDAAWLDCWVPSDIENKSQIAALMGIEVEEEVDCPRCGAQLRGDSVMFPLSRVDNRTHICNNCGTAEAMYNYLERDRDLPPVDQRIS